MLKCLRVFVLYHEHRDEQSGGMYETWFDLTIPTGLHCDLLISEREYHRSSVGWVGGKMDKVKDVQ